MKGTINLNKPITINGQLVTELTYDTEEITAALFCEADTRRRIDGRQSRTWQSFRLLNLTLDYTRILAWRRSSR